MASVAAKTNLKRTPIPVVPMTMKIVNPDGTPTRSGQLLLEQLQNVLADGSSGGTGAGTTLIAEVPTGTINSTNKAFTLSKTPAGPILLFLNGVEQLDGTDYTLSGSTITYAAAPVTGDWHKAYYGISGIISMPSPVIGFVMNSGAAGTNVGPMLAAPHSGAVSKCVAVTKASDAATGLTFMIKRNGTSVFTTNPTIAAGTGAGTVSTFTALTSPTLSITAGDVFSIDITAGAATWQFSAQLE